jgi:hypothetical protein
VAKGQFQLVQGNVKFHRHAISGDTVRVNDFETVGEIIY